MLVIKFDENNYEHNQTDGIFPVVCTTYVSSCFTPLLHSEKVGINQRVIS